jgi:hypothetical protein
MEQESAVSINTRQTKWSGPGRISVNTITHEVIPHAIASILGSASFYRYMPAS